MKFILFCLLLGGCYEETTRLSRLGEFCGQCEEGLYCHEQTCTIPCQAVTASAPDCYNGKGACLLTITQEGTVGLCYPKCDDSEACDTGLPVIYRNVCVCIP
jgi:hypothetical protein